MKRLSTSKSSISTVVAAVVVIIIIVIAAGAVYLVLGTGGTTTTTSSTSSSTSTTSTTSTTTTSSSSTTSTTTTSSTSSTAHTIQITFGATLSMTGPLSAFGTEQNWTLWNAVNYINQLGGIPLQNGSRALIHLVVLDDQTNPSIAQTNLNTLVSTDHAMVILGELGGVQDSVAQSFSSQNQIPYIGPVYISTFKTCSGSACDNSWIFAPFENETNEAHVFLNWFKTMVPPASSGPIAFFGEGDPAAVANNQAGETYAQQLGYTVCSCSDTSYTGSGNEMATFIQAAKAANVSAVYGLPTPPDAVAMLNTAKQFNFAPKAWLLTRGTAVAPFALTALGGVGNLSLGVMSAFPWQPAAPYNGSLFGHTVSNSFIVSQYESAWKHPPTLEGVYYTEVLVAADAINLASNLTNVAIRQQLRTDTFQTVMGTVNFTPGGQWVQSDATINLMQWQIVSTPNGPIQSLQILEPTSIATTNYIIYPYSFWNATTPQATLPWP